jgi:hypothetical protein
VRSAARKRVFAAAAAVLLAFAFVAGTRDRGSESRHPAPGRRGAGIAVIETRSAARAPTRFAPRRRRPARSRSPGRIPSTAGSEREPSHAPAVTPSDAGAAIAASRAFLHGYLPYSYGRADAHAIRAAGAGLGRALQAAQPRVPPAVAEDRPRPIAVRAQAATGDRTVAVLAVVDDGQRRYAIALRLRRAGGRWLVTRIGG